MWAVAVPNALTRSAADCRRPHLVLASLADMTLRELAARLSTLSPR